VTPITPGDPHTSHPHRAVKHRDRQIWSRYPSGMATLRPDHLEVPLPRRFNESSRGWPEAMARHRAAVSQGVASYLDPVTGRAVFTAKFLADRAYCCDSGCRHCPYAP